MQEGIRQAVQRILPLERIQMHDISVRTKEVIGATIYGVLVISAIQGTLGTIIFSILGLPSPLLWGVVAGATLLASLQNALRLADEFTEALTVVTGLLLIVSVLAPNVASAIRSATERRAREPDQPPPGSPPSSSASPSPVCRPS